MSNKQVTPQNKSSIENELFSLDVEDNYPTKVSNLTHLPVLHTIRLAQLNNTPLPWLQLELTYTQPTSQ